MDLTKLILDSVNNDAILELLTQNLGEDKTKIVDASKSIMPALLDGMNQNIQSKNGLSSLMEALSEHENTKIDQPKSFLDNIDLKDGEKILGHLLGANKTKVQKEVAKSSGLSNESTAKLMMMLAPLLMGFLGKEKKSQSNFGADILIKMLAGEGAGSLLTNILKGQLTSKDKSKNENPVVDILGKLLK